MKSEHKKIRKENMTEEEKSIFKLMSFYLVIQVEQPNQIIGYVNKNKIYLKPE